MVLSRNDIMSSGLFSLKDMCSAATASIPHSIAGILWSIITMLWSWYWVLIVVGLIGWIVFEIVTRNGTMHYNSENGFSPPFNRFVGAGTYLGFQTLIYLLLKLIFGDGVYCMGWPLVLHLAVFGTTGLFLYGIGFWPYLVEPGTRRKYRRKRYR